MAFDMCTFIVFLSALMAGIKAGGAVGVFIGIAIGAAVGLTFYSGVGMFVEWLPRRLGIFESTAQQRYQMLAGWMLAVLIIIWVILCASCAFRLTKLILSVFPSWV